MILISAPVASPDFTRSVTVLRVERRQLAKRIWRAVTPDQREFGFDLPLPLQPGQTFFEDETGRYVVEQEPEAVLQVALATLPPSAAAGVGWAVGNLHLELSADAQRLLTPDEPAARQLFDRIGIPYEATQAVFRPGRFTRGGGPVAPASHELGSSHRH